jgi:hypothetical protein
MPALTTVPGDSSLVQLGETPQIHVAAGADRAARRTASMSCGARAKRVRARLSLAERVARLASGDQVAGC